MSIMSPIACLLNWHEPVRREVVWNGRAYVGECRHCNTPIQRLGRRVWRRRRDDAAHSNAPTPSSR